MVASLRSQILTDCDSQSESTTKQTQNAESALDSANQNNPSLRADSQNLRGNPPCEKKSQNPQRGWLLRDARKFYGLPRSHLLIRNDKILDSSLTLRMTNRTRFCDFARVAEFSIKSLQTIEVMAAKAFVFVRIFGINARL